MKNIILFWIMLSLPGTGAIPLSALSGAAPQRGIASWYSESDPFINERTASGEVFDDTEAACASWDYPFGTYVKIVNVENGKSVICRVNDRGPRRDLKRVIDLTKSSFERIADTERGLIEVTITPLRYGSPLEFQPSLDS